MGSALHRLVRRCRNRTSRRKGFGLGLTTDRGEGQAPKKFAQLHLGEYAKRKFETLKSRLSRYVQPTPPQLLRGDANRVVTQVVRTIPPTDTLSLGFLDPYGLHLHFTTVQKLSERSTDLIIFFPDHIDVLRNWQAYYADDPESNLDRVLGTSAWRDRKAATPPDRWIEVLRELYEGQLRTLGYAEFRYERIRNSEGRPLYRLIFCSRHKMGGDLWTRTSSKKPDEQRHFEW